MIAVLALSLFSCGKKPDDGEVLAAFADLYQKSVTVNEHVFGKGIDYDGGYDTNALSSPYYVAVSEQAPYKTKADFEKAVLEVYSKAYYETTLYQVIFGSEETDSTRPPRYKEDKDGLKIDITQKGFDITGRFDTASATVVKSSGSSATVKAAWSSGETTKSVEIRLVNEGNGWRLDEPTY